jgi:uncharacterized delta-60 repeat protein
MFHKRKGIKMNDRHQDQTHNSGQKATNSIIKHSLFIISKSLIITLLLALLMPASARAVAADDGFNPGADGWVFDMAVQSDGGIIVAGSFTTLAGQSRQNLGRLYPDGSVDLLFNPGASREDLISGEINAVVVQPDDKIIVGGWFDTLGDGTRHYLGRLNANGTLDETFVDSNVNGGVYALALQPDGKVLIGGFFNTFGLVTQQYIARLNADGTLDTSFNPVINGSVRTIAVQPDGRILVGGEFTLVDGETHARLVRLNPNGSLDASFNSNADGTIFTIALQADGKIIVGGYDNFTLLNGQPRDHIGRLNPNGSLDEDFDPGTNGKVTGLAVQPDGRILLGGHFSSVAGTSRLNLGRLMPDGSLDTSFIAEVGPIYERVATVDLQLDGKILVGGTFEELGGATRMYLGRLYPDGRLDGNFNVAANDWVLALANQPDGKILVGGLFTMLAGEERNFIGRLNVDGTLDAGFNPGADDEVRALVVQPDGKILVGGSFDTLAGSSRIRLGRLYPDGTLDETFAPTMIGVVFALALQPDGKILVGGDFDHLNGEERDNLGRLNPDGTLDEAFNTGANEFVDALAIQSDGKILVGGYFTELGIYSASYMDRLFPNGDTDTFFSANSDYFPRGFLVQPDGWIVVGGEFIMLSGSPRVGIGRLDPNGYLDSSFEASLLSGSNIVTLALQTDGKIALGGDFSTMDGQPHANLGRMHANGSVDHSFTAGTDSYIRSLVLQPDGKMLVGGRFTILDGQSHQNLGRLSNDTAAIQNLDSNPDGTGITWLRSGAGPEVWRVWFELSTDGENYTFLGNGTRISGGWHLTGLDLPRAQNLWIRARGSYTSGANNSSGSIIESVRNVYLAPLVFYLPMVIK